MQIEIRIDSACREPKLILVTDQITDELQALVKQISGERPQGLLGFQEDTAALLEQADLIRIHTAAGRVLAVTDQGEYSLRLRLYELEERLDKSRFVRISHGEIINLKKVRRFDLSLSGTICVELCNGSLTYVSRRYVPKIKQVLGI